MEQGEGYRDLTDGVCVGVGVGGTVLADTRKMAACPVWLPQRGCVSCVATSGKDTSRIFRIFRIPWAGEQLGIDSISGCTSDGCEFNHS